jgi:NADH-quinone oxidoreductase subunit K/NAD(P)H-quinone oxidoreductase subunit 4L
MSGPPLQAYLVVGALLFGIGVAGVLSQRSALMILMSAEIILNAALLDVVAFWRFGAAGNLDAHVLVLIGMTIGAAEIAAGIGLLLLLFRQRKSVSVDVARELRG